ncbi:MAG: endonuclease/exonuclease/phosphatase family protein [Actinobacteria bacterium]|nr:endonuclease/exonuclease/phosphatase family protein [Actinomycetota bacterium]
MSQSTGAGPARGPGAAATLVPAVALATVLLLDVLRVWMPSVIFIHGRAGSTPAEEMGLFALVWVVLGLVAAALVPVVRPGPLLLLAAGLLAGSRLVLQLWDAGGQVQLYAASLGWVAAMAFLGALAAAAPPGRSVAAGLTLGLVADATLRAATGSVELTWIGGVAGTLAGVLLIAAFVAAVVSVHRSRLLTEGGDTDGRPAWPWLGVGPVLVLYGVLAGTPARVATSVDLAPWATAGLTVAALALGAAWALSSSALPPAASAPAAAVTVIVGTILAAPATGWSAVAGHVLLAVGLGGSLGVLAHVRGTSTATRRSLAAAGSLALLFVVAFLYYAAYDIALGVGNRVFLQATAAAVVVAVLAAGRRMGGPRGLATGRALPLGLTGAVLLATAGAMSAGTPDPRAGDGLPVRAMLYNVHMGFDTVGRFDTDALAAVIADQDADIVVLNEVDRGWFLNGSHDVLGLLASELDMTYVFAPAADEIWGNAILSRFPVVSSEAGSLPRGGAPMARSFVSAILDLGGGQHLAVVGTHLHHLDSEPGIRRPQAEAVAAEAERLAGTGVPVVVMGDMNATPGDAELEPYLDAGLEDAVTPSGEVLTFPSWDPVEHIDHVFVSSELAATDLVVPGSQASDHLGVALTLTRR